MPATSLHDLCEQLCARLGLPAPLLTPDEHGMLAFTVEVHGVDFAFSHDPAGHPREAVLHVFYGPLPAGDERAVLDELLEANFDMDKPGDPVFSINRRTREVVLRMVLRLDDADERVMAGMEAASRHVLSWREARCEAGAPAGPMPGCIVPFV